MSTAVTPTTSQLKPAATRMRERQEKIDEALRAALYLRPFSAEAWGTRIEQGADDDSISHTLTDQWADSGGSSTPSGVKFAYKSLPELLFWIDTSSPLTTAKPTLQGKRLIRRVREVLGIPPPGTGSPEAAGGAGEVSTITEGGGESSYGGSDNTADGRPYEAMSLKELRVICKEREVFIPLRTRKAADIIALLRAHDAGGKASASADIATPGDGSGEWHQYFEQTPGEGCFLRCGQPEDSPVHQNPRQAAFVPGGGCPPDCGHTTEEHDAFDAGVAAGERGDTAECPLEGPERAAWLTGYVVGLENRSADSATSGDVVEPTPATEDAPAPRVFTKEVEVELTDHDYKVKSKLLAAKRIQIAELVAEKKQTDESYKQKIGGLEQECADIYRVIMRGRDELELEVFERRDFDRKIVETVREDTGDVVESRPMKPTEYQQPLPSI